MPPNCESVSGAVIQATGMVEFEDGLRTGILPLRTGVLPGGCWGPKIDHT